MTTKEKRALVRLEKKKLKTEEKKVIINAVDSGITKVTDLFKADAAVSFFTIEAILLGLQRFNILNPNEFTKWSGLNLGLNVMRATKGSEAGAIAGAGIIGGGIVASVGGEVDKVIQNREKDLLKESGITVDFMNKGKEEHQRRLDAGEHFRYRKSFQKGMVKPFPDCIFIGIDGFGGKMWACPLTKEEAKQINPIWEGIAQTFGTFMKGI